MQHSNLFLTVLCFWIFAFRTKIFSTLVLFCVLVLSPIVCSRLLLGLDKCTFQFYNFIFVNFEIFPLGINLTFDKLISRPAFLFFSCYCFVIFFISLKFSLIISLYQPRVVYNFSIYFYSVFLSNHFSKNFLEYTFEKKVW